MNAELLTEVPRKRGAPWTPEYKKEYARLYYQKNKERFARYEKDHRERINEWRRQRLKVPGIAERKKEVALKSRRKNAEKTNARAKEWRKTAPLWEKRYLYSLNKTSVRGGQTIGHASIREFYRQVFTQSAAICDYCRGIFPIRDIVIDHKQPFALGGCHVVTNLSVSCQPCNRKKWHKPYDSWIAEIERKS